MRYKAVIFDMDGTVLDTIEDLAGAVSYAMRAGGHEIEITEGLARELFGSGALVALERALSYENGMPVESLAEIGAGSEHSDPRTDGNLLTAETVDEARLLLPIFKRYYPEHCEEHTAPFTGIKELLTDLQAAGVKTAVISNKIDAAVQELADTHFPGLLTFALGESSAMRRKPYPDMIEMCLEVMNVKAEDAVYVGDSEIDIQTAENAAMDCISVTWGFRSEQFLKTNGASRIAHTVDELALILQLEPGY